MDAAEYKHVILGLIFLKYLSDKFELQYDVLKAEGEGFEEDKDAYLEKNIFYVPAADWGTLLTFLRTSRWRITATAKTF